MKALSLRQVDRYQSVKRLQKDIEAYQGGFATSAEHAGLGRHIKLFFVRHKVVASLGAVAGVSLIAGSIISTTQWFRAAEESRKAKAAFKELKGTAPALVAQSERHMEEADLDAALKQISYACDLDENNAEYHLKRGNVLQAMLQLTEASKAYDRASKLDPSLAVARENADLCRAIVKEYKGKKGSGLAVVGKLFRSMVQQNRYSDAMAMLRKHVPDAKNVEGFYREMLKAKGVAVKGLKVDEKGMIELDLGGTGISDLSPLKGMPLTSLNLDRCGQVTDLSPLKGMPLTSLNLWGCSQADITPLKGMPLTSLNLGGTKVIDLSPLKGMPLTSLSLYGCNQVSDLSPLKGMPLTSLSLAHCGQVTDLSPLKGMPLASLDLGHCGKITDLSPLEAMELKYMLLHGTLVTDISALSDMPLIGLCLEHDVGGYHDTMVTDFAPLKHMKTLQFLAKSLNSWMAIGSGAGERLLNSLLSAIAAKDSMRAQKEAEGIIADWSDVPAMASVVQRVKICIEVFIPLMTNPNKFPAAVKSFNGHHYYMWPYAESWAGAKKFCESVGGHLVTITSGEEHGFVMQMITGISLKSHCHIGGEREGTTPEWITGEKWEEEPTFMSIRKTKTLQGEYGVLCPIDMPEYALKKGDVYFYTDYNRHFIIEWDR